MAATSTVETQRRTGTASPHFSRALRAALLWSACVPGIAAAQADVYPVRVIRVVNSLAAGSSADHLNRACGRPVGAHQPARYR